MILGVAFICGILTHFKEKNMLEFSISCPLTFTLEQMEKSIEVTKSTKMLPCYCDLREEGDPETIEFEGEDLNCKVFDEERIKAEVLSYLFIFFIFVSEHFYVKVVHIMVDFERNTDLNGIESSRYKKSVLFNIICTGVMVFFVSLYSFNIFGKFITHFFLGGEYFQLTPFWYQTIGSLQIATFLGEDIMKSILEITMVMWNQFKQWIILKKIEKGMEKRNLAKLGEKLEGEEFSLEEHATGNSGHIFAGIMLGAGIPGVYLLITLFLFFKYFWEKALCTPNFLFFVNVCRGSSHALFERPSILQQTHFQRSLQDHRVRHSPSLDSGHLDVL